MFLSFQTMPNCMKYNTTFTFTFTFPVKHLDDMKPSRYCYSEEKKKKISIVKFEEEIFPLPAPYDRQSLVERRVKVHRVFINSPQMLQKMRSKNEDEYDYSMVSTRCFFLSFVLSFFLSFSLSFALCFFVSFFLSFFLS